MGAITAKPLRLLGSGLVHAIGFAAVLGWLDPVSRCMCAYPSGILVVELQQSILTVETRTARVWPVRASVPAGSRSCPGPFVDRDPDPTFPLQAGLPLLPSDVEQDLVLCAHFASHGRVDVVRVLVSSGNDEADEAASRQLKGLLFEPAVIADRAASSWHRIVVHRAAFASDLGATKGERAR
jgi:hypothetical protein